MNIKQIFKYRPKREYNFTLTPPAKTNMPNQEENKDITNDISQNLKYIESKYNTENDSPFDNLFFNSACICTFPGSPVKGLIFLFIVNNLFRFFIV